MAFLDGEMGEVIAKCGTDAVSEEAESRQEGSCGDPTEAQKCTLNNDKADSGAEAYKPDKSLDAEPKAAEQGKPVTTSGGTCEQEPKPESTQRKKKEEKAIEEKSEEGCACEETLNWILDELKKIKENDEGLKSELREMRKLYHNEFSGRLTTLQAELDRYREIEKGRIYDDILKEIGKLYCNNVSVVERSEDEKTKKQLGFLFMDMRQLLENYGASIQKSEPGEMRSARFCQVIEHIKTDDPAKNNTVAASRCAGVYVENRALIREMIDVYVYDESEKATDERDGVLD